MKPAALITATVLLVGCGPQGDPETATPDLYVDGVGVVVQGNRPWLHGENFPSDIGRIVAVTSAYAGGSVADLNGWTIVFSEDATVDCGYADRRFAGCTWHDTKTIVVAATSISADLDGTILPHEIIHAVLGGDRCHQNPIWRDLTPLATDLCGSDACAWKSQEWETGETCH